MSNACTSPVAAIGTASRLPGGIGSPDLLREALLRGDDLVAPVYGIDMAILSIIQSPERFGAAGALRDLPKGFAQSRIAR
ncbi:hypothetical protein BST28_20565 [Mycolicibacter kumamotonensis]|uniref:Uncharacterized protein n=1 Tax=Mycolicibacter kumamotonensis TaxID=354243 RepID=A0A1X0DWV4_9MYCO|nr:hypothetical protein BST28_20565 [Mycolicibacter kumamotonensis]